MVRSVVMWNGSDLFFFNVTASSSLLKWKTVQSVAMWSASVLFFSIYQRRDLWSDGKRFSLLGCRTDEFGVFRCNNVEFSGQIGNGSVCCDVERISFVFFDVTMSSSLVRWETVQSVGMWNGSVMSFFDITTPSSLLRWETLQWKAIL